MAKNKFTFTTAEGKVETRSTERVYTHVVVERINIAAVRADLNRHQQMRHKQDTKDFRFFVAMATGEVGAIPKVEGGWNYPLSADDKARYAERIAGYKDADDYAAKRHQASVDAIAKKYGDADVGPEYVSQWSMSEANARKGAKASQFVAVVRVAPVDQK